MRARYKELIERFGLVAVLVYLTTSVCVFVPSLLLLQNGVDLIGWLQARGVALPDAVLTGGNVLLAWGVVKATQLPRLVVTAAVTPIVGQYIKLPMPGLEAPSEEPAAEATPASPDADPANPEPEKA